MLTTIERYLLLCGCLRSASTSEEASIGCECIMAMEREPVGEGEMSAAARLQALDERLAETALMTAWMERDATSLAANNRRRL